ncbi:DNA repair protein RecN [Olsenella sp. HMSC062G07]|uniref:DNA repair protein RecN n=1 Tax=Olsenella sp. HMSC062G07 TaxID=1739330 RepID=UPI0008A5DD98|nr:AAA family ATPase [Olsenella sp. HMSC062G07]OFK24863.1 DNA repair protein RecN [Olsenella sp. HMSC062G07]
MIDELAVRDVALIREATIEPASGLTVLTGETGTGKTALLTAVKLIMGERADAGSVREGAQGLLVEGRLFLRGGDPDGVVVSRGVGADGRGRVRIDGRVASVRELAEGVGASIDLCGQHEHQRLMRRETHVDLLDAWAADEVGPARVAYGQALVAARAARAELRRLRELTQAADARLEDASFTLERIDEVAPLEGELERIEEELPRFEHADTLLRAATGAHDAIVGDGGVEDALSDVIQGLRDAAGFDARLEGFASSLESALIDMGDVASELRRYGDGVDVDEEALARMQERMAQLQGLMRRFGPGMDDVLARRRAALELVESARDGGRRLKGARSALDAAEARLDAAADELDRVRGLAAPRLMAAINEQLRFLEMGTAQVEMDMSRRPRRLWAEDGPSEVELLYRPAAGLLARPLRKIASGGEVSRVMLACKAVLGDADGVETLVFDEIDAGVGGSAAVALAQVLARLARTHQVIVVTHLPQVAVVGMRHYVVEKSAGAHPQTTLRLVEGEQRVREVARMLAGDESDVSIAHARQLLGLT